jgi:hypothetical protein
MRKVKCSQSPGSEVSPSNNTMIISADKAIGAPTMTSGAQDVISGHLLRLARGEAEVG